MEEEEDQKEKNQKKAVSNKELYGEYLQLSREASAKTFAIQQELNKLAN
jgi:hypothetical protein